MRIISMPNIRINSLNNSLSWNDHIETVIKNAKHISIFYHESQKLVRLQKRAARVIIDCDFYTPLSTILSL